MDGNTGKKITNTDECKHKVVEYGPCRSGLIGYEHEKKTCELCKNRRGYNTVNNTKFHDGCRYRTYLEDYVSAFQNTDNEQIEISDLCREEYQAWYKITSKNDSNSWMHTRNFEDFEKIRNNFTPCAYYDQPNKGIISSHSIFNYANFLTFLRLNTDPLPQKDLLVLDEGHSIENQIVEQVGVSISKKILQRYIATAILENISYGYDDSIEKSWLVFLESIRQELEDAIPDMQSEETRVSFDSQLSQIFETHFVG